MKKVVLITALILAVVLVGLITRDHKTPASTNVIKGVSLTPISFSGQKFAGFWQKAKEAGGFISWAGNWKDLKNPKSAPCVAALLAKNNGLTFVAIVSFEENVDVNDYEKTLSDFAARYKIKYLGVGNEVNRYSITKLDKLATQFSEIRDKIKRVSPNTKVFTTFQFETGADLTTALNKFPDSDLTGITTYPEIVGNNDPDALPANYYSKLSTDRKVAFTEIGWTGTDETKQAGFIKRFFEITKTLNPEFVIWPFLYDQKIQAPFNSMGLIDSNEIPKTSWDVWKSASF